MCLKKLHQPSRARVGLRLAAPQVVDGLARDAEGFGGGSDTSEP
jgi:hypothetical protein